MGKKYVIASLSLALIYLHLSGCALRSAVIKEDQIQYNVLIANSINKQMVLNLVRERYSEMPFFLQPPTIASGFNYMASLGLGASVPEASATLLTQSISTLLPAFSNSISLSPTITYVPLDGEKYASSMLTEITFDTFVSLHRSGWESKTLLPMLVSRIGDNKNDPKMEGIQPPPKTYENFRDIVEELIVLSDRADLDFVTEPPHKHPSAQDSACTESKCSKGKSSTQPLRWVMKARYVSEKEAQDLESLLGIQPRIHKWNDATGRYEGYYLLSTIAGMEQIVEDKPVVRLRLRSFEETLFFLSGGVKVPPEDGEKAGVPTKKAGVVIDPDAEARLLHIHCSSIPPAEAFISVHYRGHYFYINDTDKDSKRAFALLVCLFSLQAGNFPAVSPVLTIPVGTSGR